MKRGRRCATHASKLHVVPVRVYTYTAPALVQPLSVSAVVLTLVEQLQTFRDKREPYVLCIGILTKVFTCHRRRAAFPREEMVEVNRRVGLIIEYHARRAAMERKCIAYAKPGTSVAFLVEAKRKLRDSIFQGDSLAAMAKLIASST